MRIFVVSFSLCFSTSSLSEIISCGRGDENSFKRETTFCVLGCRKLDWPFKVCFCNLHVSLPSCRYIAFHLRLTPRQRLYIEQVNIVVRNLHNYKVCRRRQDLDARKIESFRKGSHQKTLSCTRIARETRGLTFIREDTFP